MPDWAEEYFYNFLKYLTENALRNWL